MNGPQDEVTVIHDPAAQQFRVCTGAEAAVLQYRLTADRITFLHTFVPKAFRGKRIAQRLAHAGLEHAKAEGLRVVAICPFVQAYLRKHPEYRALVED